MFIWHNHRPLRSPLGVIYIPRKKSHKKYAVLQTEEWYRGGSYKTGYAQLTLLPVYDPSAQKAGGKICPLCFVGGSCTSPLQIFDPPWGLGTEGRVIWGVVCNVQIIPCRTPTLRAPTLGIWRSLSIPKSTPWEGIMCCLAGNTAPHKQPTSRKQQERRWMMQKSWMTRTRPKG